MRKYVKLLDLPQRLGIHQEVNFSYNEYSRQYEGVLIAEGCRRGICIKYRALVFFRDGSEWETKKPRRREKLELGGCLRHQAVADALWELAGKYDVGVWYEYRPRCVVFTYLCPDRELVMENCGIVINGVKLNRPYCRTVEECIEEILRDYRREVERMKEPPQPSPPGPAEELLREWPELGVFGAEWVRAWLPYAKERLVEIAKVLRNHPKAKAIIGTVGIRENPYLIEIYISGEEECVAVNTDVFCLSADKPRKMPLEYIGLKAPRGLLMFTKRKEFTRVA
jgi:hypothetical protein